jgi:hypothetical protein
MTLEIAENQAVLYSRSIKISDTGKGIRIDVHVYTNDSQEAISQAFKMDADAQDKAREKGIQLAPMEGVNGKLFVQYVTNSYRVMNTINIECLCIYSVTRSKN